ncbi:MAG: hypothetical protein M3542_08920 [Acidobacteriota bacterium]|nr:hypothetical protein [Acidobacteriota bacterium]
MGKVNWSRVFLGGLVAGIVINLGEFLFHTVVFKTQVEEAMRAMGKDPAAMNAGTAMTVWVIWCFLLGIGAVWTYAAIRPRYGAGAKTATIAGVAVWFLACFLSSLAMMNMGLMAQSFLVTALIWGLVEYVLATIAGAYFYKET